MFSKNKERFVSSCVYTFTILPYIYFIRNLVAFFTIDYINEDSLLAHIIYFNCF